MKKQQTNFRFDAGVKAILKQVAGQSGLSETQVVEACIAKHALSIQGLADEARAIFTKVMAEHLGKNKTKKKTS